MVGGEVIGVTEYGDGTTRVLCAEYVDFRSGRRLDTANAAYIKVKRPVGDRKIQVGDCIWWQGRKAMWTPKENHIEDPNDDLVCGADYDIQLERIGYSVGANL
jgi:hypothetical protein